ncbi:MAG: TetR/AcrR family transcriptional regulator, partial [Mycobacteriaceae bacterium]|nr:TetR/AcrR family transcriptional regulator [Mycobacteriaceae bacterium]
LASDNVARAGVQLLRAFGEFNEAAAGVYTVWQAEMAAQVRRAQADGDVRDDVDAEMIGQMIVAAMVGQELISTTVSRGADLVARITRTWEILLPAITTAESLPFIREFLARESLRHLDPSAAGRSSGRPA